MEQQKNNYKFSKEQIERLSQGWVGEPGEGELLTIKGINAVGDEFTTIGRITTTDQGRAGIDEDKIWIEFGVSKSSPDRKQTKFFAPFELNIERSEYAHGLIVKSIENESGELIYVNDKFDEIEKIAVLNKKDNEKKHTQLIEEDSVTTALKNMIGKAIILGDIRRDNLGEYTGVLESIDHINRRGEPVVECFSGPGMFNTFVTITSVLKEENNKGKIRVIEINDPDLSLNARLANSEEWHRKNENDSENE